MSPRVASRLGPEGEPRPRTESVMLNAIEHLMRLRPASHFGWERRQTGLELFEDLERPHPRPRYRYETERREPAWLIGQVASVAILIVFCGVLTVIARVAGDATDAGQQPDVAISDVPEPR